MLIKHHLDRFSDDAYKAKVMDEEADLKSIMNVMALVVPTGNKFSIIIEGDDEEKAELAFNKLLPEIDLQ